MGGFDLNMLGQLLQNPTAMMGAGMLMQKQQPGEGFMAPIARGALSGLQMQGQMKGMMDGGMFGKKALEPEALGTGLSLPPMQMLQQAGPGAGMMGALGRGLRDRPGMMGISPMMSQLMGRQRFPWY